MRSIIEELNYGTVTPYDRDIIKGGTYSHLLHLVTRNEDDLMQTLTQAQQETFEKFKDCASELNDANEVTSFALGFKLGMRLALEAMISTSDITEPKCTNNKAPSHLETGVVALFATEQLTQSGTNFR